MKICPVPAELLHADGQTELDAMDSVRIQVYYNESHTEHFKCEQYISAVRQVFVLPLNITSKTRFCSTGFIIQTTKKTSQNTESFLLAIERTKHT